MLCPDEHNPCLSLAGGCELQTRIQTAAFHEPEIDRFLDGYLLSRHFDHISPRLKPSGKTRRDIPPANASQSESGLRKLHAGLFQRRYHDIAVSNCTVLGIENKIISFLLGQAVYDTTALADINIDDIIMHNDIYFGFFIKPAYGMD